MDTIDLKGVLEFANKNNIPRREAETRLLTQGIVPLRYIGTVRFLGIEGMLRLRQSTAGVAGLGGVGGLVCELLARLGIGHMVIVDSDVFDETNLNRQLYCIEENIGKSKARAAQARVQIVNASVEVEAHHMHITGDTVVGLFRGAHCIVDAVDNIDARLVLADGARALGIPLIHGSIGNSVCRIMTVPASSDVLERMYTHENIAESEKGNPIITAYLCAVLQVAEALKALCGIGDALAETLLQMDWLSWEQDRLNLHVL